MFRHLFCRCGIRRGLSEWFGLSKISEDCARRLWPERKFDAGRPIVPCVLVLPMGFAWSFWLGQRAHLHLSLEGSALSPSLIFVEGRSAPDIGDKVALMPYCDNGNMISTDPKQVIAVRDKIIKKLREPDFGVTRLLMQKPSLIPSESRSMASLGWYHPLPSASAKFLLCWSSCAVVRM